MGVCAFSIVQGCLNIEGVLVISRGVSCRPAAQHWCVIRPQFKQKF